MKTPEELTSEYFLGSTTKNPTNWHRLRDMFASRDRDIIEQAAGAVNDGTIAGMLAAARVRALSPAGTAPDCSLSRLCERHDGHTGNCNPRSPAGTAVTEVCGTCSGKRWVLRMSRPCPACSPTREGG